MMIKYIGFMLLLIGAAGIDSANPVVPGGIAIAGIATMEIENKKETARRQPKHSHRY